MTISEVDDRLREVLLGGARLVAELTAIRDLRRHQEDPDRVKAATEAWRRARSQWWAETAALHDSGVSVPLVELARRLSLDARSLDVLLVILAPSIDSELLDAIIGDDPRRWFRGITASLLLGLVFHSAEERFAGRELLSPHHDLVRHRLLSLVPIGSELAPTEVEVRPSEGLTDFILSRPLVSGPLAQYCELAEPTHGWNSVILPPEDKERVWALVSGTPKFQQRLDEWGYGPVLPRSRGVVLLFAGPPGTGKSMLAQAIAARLERRVLSVFTSRLLARRESIRPILTEAFQVAALAEAIVIIDDCEAMLAERDERFLALLECLDRHDGILVLTTNDAPRIDFAMERRIQFRLDFELPGQLLREGIWETHLPPEAPLSDDIDVPALAAAYEFTGARIRNTVMLALAQLEHRGGEKLDMALLRESADTQLGARFDELAIKAGGSFGLERLVLPERETEQLREVLQACRQREFVLTRWGFGKRLATGRGLCILMDGPPGTGKTFSAEILANELRLPLYRVHIPNVVSKWVGETERNIAKIFSRARAARAVLLFDEADSLFGRRSANAESANDRYANMEVNLLLQEIERYDGITFLTTNLYGNLDEALQRRIQFRVTFPFPEAPERARIWEVLTPPEAPLDPDVSFKALGAEFELAGGHIKNAILRAAYRAADAGTAITQQHLLEAAVAECQAQGRIVRATSGTRRA